MPSSMLRYKDTLLRSKQFIWLHGRDAWNNFMLERMSISKRRTLFGRKTFKMISSIRVLT